MAYSFSAREFDEYIRDQQRRAREHERLHMQAENQWRAGQVPARLPDECYQQASEGQPEALNKSAHETLKKVVEKYAQRKPDLRVLLCQ